MPYNREGGSSENRHSEPLLFCFLRNLVLVVVSPVVADQTDQDASVHSLDLERSRKFLQHLVDDPFVTVVVTDEGEVRVFSKDIAPEHLERIKQVLTDLNSEGDSVGK